MKALPALTQLFAYARYERLCIMPRTDAVRRALTRRIAEGTVLRVYRGLYAEASYWKVLDPLERTRHIVRSLSIAHPDWVFCGPTAAIMHKLDCPYRLTMPICIAARPDTHAHSSRALARHVITHLSPVTVDSAAVTDLPRTLFDIAALQPLRFALPSIDSALRERRITATQLAGWGVAFKYTLHRENVARAFALADGRSENGGESEGRGLLADLGYPVHDLQVEFPCLGHPNRTHRVDYLWKRDDGSMIAGEFDGTRKYVDPTMTKSRTIRQVVDEERNRQQCLAHQGVDMIRMYYDDLNQPYVLSRRLQDKHVPRSVKQ